MSATLCCGQDSVAAWLSSRIFEGGGITLFLSPDGFFALRKVTPRNRVQDMTGLWRLSEDGVELDLFNYQDKAIKIAVGSYALHGSFGDSVSHTLLPTQKEKMAFTITGVLERGAISDAASGRSFKVEAAPEVAEGKFATAELEAGVAGYGNGRILRHSGTVPRFFERPPAQTGAKVFMERLAGSFLRVPPVKGVERAALRFGDPVRQDNELLEGQFEVTGPGLRFEGNYTLNGNKLTLTAAENSLRNLRIIGAEALADNLLGEFTWQVSPRGLELSGPRTILLTGGNL